MAKILTEEILKALKKFDLPKGYQRTGEFPLDPSSMFFSKADADLYASGGADSRGLSGTRYAGQLISVVEGGVTSLYTVEANDTLKAVGGDVSADLADLTSKVNAILAGADDSLNTFAEVKAKFDSLPKDMVVSGGEVRVPTEEEIAADPSLVANEKYIILTIANAEAGKDKLYIKAKDLVDVYTGGDYVTVSGANVIDVNVTAFEAKLTADGYAKQTDITAATSTLATQAALNTVSEKATNNEKNIATNTASIEAINATLETKADSSALNTAKEELTAEIGNKANQADLEAATARITAIENGVKVKDVDTTASHGVQLSLVDGKVGVTADLAEVKKGITYNATEIATVGAIGTNKAGDTVETVLSTLSARITSAVSGGLTNVAAGNGIAVSGISSNSQIISVKIAEGSNNLHVDETGLSLVWIEE